MRSVQYKKGVADTTSNMSGAIWGDIPLEDYCINFSGSTLVDDFENCNKMSANGAQQTQTYASFTTNGGTIQPSAATADSSGALVFTPNAAGNAEAYMGPCGGVGYLCSTPNSSAVGNRFMFECRLKKSTIAATNIGFFVGVADPALIITTGTLVNTTGLPISTGNFLGFLCQISDGAVVQTCYQANGQAFTAVNATAATMVASTYLKLGFRFDPSAPATKKMRFFINGLEQTATTQYITSTNIAAATFPSATLLTPIIATKYGAGATGTVTADWWCFAQDRT